MQNFEGISTLASWLNINSYIFFVLDGVVLRVHSIGIEQVIMNNDENFWQIISITQTEKYAT